MNEFTEIVRFVARNRFKKNSFLLKKSKVHGEDKYHTAYEGILNGKLKEDENIAEALGMQADSPQYRTFRSRFRDKLVRTLIWLDPAGYKASAHTKAAILCSLYVYAAKMGLKMGIWNTSVRIMKLALSKALQFEQLDVILFCSRYLMQHAGLTADKQMFNKMRGLNRKYSKAYEAEGLAEEYYSEILTTISLKGSAQRKFTNQALRYMVALNDLRKEHDLYIINLRYYQVTGIAHQMNRDYQSSVDSWEECRQYLERYRHFEGNVRFAEAELNLLGCNLYIGAYEEAARNAEKCLELYGEKNPNWLIAQYYYFFVCMHTGHYAKAGEILKRSVNNYYFPFMRPAQQEEWRILQAYYLLVRPDDRSEAGQQNFRLQQFLQEVPIYTKDKKGINVSILTVQIMHFLKKGEFENIADRIRSLERYRRKYLNDKDNFRSRIFLEMIFLAAKADFDPAIAREKTQRQSKMLQQSRNMRNEFTINVEIVPFDRLWEYALGFMEKKPETYPVNGSK